MPVKGPPVGDVQFVNVFPAGVVATEGAVSLTDLPLVFAFVISVAVLVNGKEPSEAEAPVQFSLVEKLIAVTVTVIGLTVCPRMILTLSVNVVCAVRPDEMPLAPTINLTLASCCSTW